MKINDSTRRRFLKTTGAVALTAGIQFLPRRLLGGSGHTPPSEMLTVALVGAGGRGLQNAGFLLAEGDVKIVAVADPAEHYSLEHTYYKGFGGRMAALELVKKHDETVGSASRCAGYADFRVLMERERGVDAIVCSTPDHLHALISIMAMRAGKHVYCEKPLTHNIREARLVARVAQETGVATQMGNHGHSTNGIRETVEHLRAGTIGVVREVHVWSPARRVNPAVMSVPKERPAVPSGFDWDLWLGPREGYAYHPAYHPMGWRDFWAFGGAGLGDMGCHDMDAAAWGLDLFEPSSIEGFGAGPRDDEVAPQATTVFYRFPERQGRPPLMLTWRDNGLRPPSQPELEGFALPQRGVLFLGEKGAIECDGGGGAPRIFPRSLRLKAKTPPAEIPRVKGHHRDWINACKGGPSASSAFEHGARLTELVLLGVLAIRTRKRIEWNAAGMSVQSGVPGAEQILHGTYRPGWEIVEQREIPQADPR